MERTAAGVKQDRRLLPTLMIATMHVFTWRPACERHSFDRNDSVDSMIGAASLVRRLFL
jgi:hypothetical protein